ncbi:ATP-binding cassette domain-containing protein [Sinorhizobium meliloti]|uniref:sugar ABC transporter ATP-binding protein n=1 Tax=Rhizobium meliloti TaxID=382 RepID=UPI00299F3FA0|nr:ATP-binding cassette domain-containing protein [Sinorhizobium meliloti]
MNTTTESHSAVAGKSVPLLDMRGIFKSFGHVQVLSDIHLTCESGTLTAICGENGAGKSTLMNILSGVFAPSAGEIRIEGRLAVLSHPLQARREGIAIIHQELNLLPHRTVAENIFLGREPVRFGLLDRARMNREAAAALRRLGSNIDPQIESGKLTIAEQQLVEIAKAITTDARILILDEPTAALDDAEAQALFAVIAELKRSGVAMLYISHRMAEIKAIADVVTVIKDGRQVATMAVAETSIDNLVRLMVGRDVGTFFPPPASAPPGEPLYRVSNGNNSALRNIDITLHAGEIVGIAGLEGCGKADLARAMAGEVPFTRGDIYLHDGGGAPTSPRDAARRRIAAIPDDRKNDGLGLQQSLRDNAALTLRALAPLLGRASAGLRARGRIDAGLDDMEVRSTDYDMPVGSLSGGNQQKVMFARWKAITPRIWIVAEPTRGIDVGARATIYRMLRGFAENGGAVMIVSSDLMEIIGLCDRICVMAMGALVAELPRGAGEEEIIRHAVCHEAPLYGKEAAA